MRQTSGPGLGYSGGMARRLFRKLLKNPKDSSRKVHPLVRLASRIAGVVYPTNNSGNNTSVR